MTAEQIEKLLLRIKRSDDGPELIEYLEQLSADNYKSWKSDIPERDQEHKGYAKCIDSLLKSFQDCSKEKEVDSLATHGKHLY